MIDRKFIGMQLPDIESLVEAEMLRDFALATVASIGVAPHRAECVLCAL